MGYSAIFKMNDNRIPRYNTIETCKKISYTKIFKPTKLAIKNFHYVSDAYIINSELIKEFAAELCCINDSLI